MGKAFSLEFLILFFASSFVYPLSTIAASTSGLGAVPAFHSIVAAKLPMRLNAGALKVTDTSTLARPGAVTANPGAFVTGSVGADQQDRIFEVTTNGPYQTVAAALAAAVAARGGVIDARGCHSASALALGTLDVGNNGPAVTVLLGPFAYTAERIVLRSHFSLVGLGYALAGSAQGTQITATSTTNPLVVGPLLGTDQPAQHVQIDSVAFIGARSNSADGFFIDASASTTGLSGLWHSVFRRVQVYRFNGVAIHFRGANAPGRTGVNQVISFYDCVFLRGSSTSREAVRVEGYAMQFYFHGGFIDGHQFDMTMDGGTALFLGSGPGSGNQSPSIIQFIGTNIEGTTDLVQIDGASMVLFHGAHFEQGHGAINITYGRNGGSAATDGVIIDSSTFNGTVGVNSGNGFIVALDHSVKDKVTQVLLMKPLYYSSSTSQPDNWILNPNYGVGVTFTDANYGGIAGAGHMLNEVATPTTIFKTGTKSGTTYKTTSTRGSWAVVDDTNLAHTFTIPVGWKLLVQTSVAVQIDTAQDLVYVGIQDGAKGVLAATATYCPTVTVPFAASLNLAIAGDGASHTVSLVWFTNSAAHQAEIVNQSYSFPQMTFVLMPSN
jgi:hypothetical protein